MTSQAANPVITQRSLTMGLRSGRLRQTELGLEQRCPRCGDYWPADTEFFYSNGTRLMSACKACYIAHRWPEGRPSESASA